VKVAIGAYACGPGGGSEPGAGWEWARAAALRHDVWVFTERQWLEPIRAALRDEPALRLTPVEVPAPSWVDYPTDFARGERARYVAWQFCLRAAVRARHAEIGFDVAHHVTYAADWLPAGIAALPKVPFVWGPVGGTSPVPFVFRDQLGGRQFAVEIARGAVSATGRVLCGEVLARRASVMLAANEDVARRFRRARPRVEPNIALHLDKLPAGCGANDHGRRRAVFAGRLLAWKGVRLAVAALARPEAADWTLDIYGDGPYEAVLRAAVAEHGVGDRVRLLGARPRAEVLDALAGCDALLFPSMHDSAGWVVAEALALGRPVVCLDIGGPAMQVGDVDGSGVGPRGVRVRPRGDVVGELARALGRCPGPLAPDRRFDVARLPDLLDELYGEAVARAGRRGVAAGDHPIG
jgi:glycosyltransferase involved in cell wall biosynthesis